MMKSSKKIKPWHEFEHMVFDIDGTLLNSNLAHVWSWQDAIEAENLFMPHLTLFIQMGLPGHQILEKFSFVFRNEKIAEKIAKAASEIYSKKYVDLIAPYDGTYKLLDTLKLRKKKIYAITSSSQVEANAMMRRFNLDKYFDYVMTAAESGEGKPSAEPFLNLKEKLGSRIDLLSFGDSPYDYKASNSAGVPFVYLGHGGFPREWFAKAQACFFNINELLRSIPHAELKRAKKAA